MPADCVRGAVIEVNLDPSVGREQAKTRPCLVVANDIMNRRADFTIVLAITDAQGKTPGPTFILIPKGEGGLVKDSMVVVHQIRIVDESRLGKKYGSVKDSTMQKVDEALKIVLSLK